MWYNGSSAEIAVRCPHCGDRDWRTPAELKDGRLFCFGCVRVSAWSTEASPVAGDLTGSGARD